MPLDNIIHFPNEISLLKPLYSECVGSSVSEVHLRLILHKADYCTVQVHFSTPVSLLI